MRRLLVCLALFASAGLHATSLPSGASEKIHVDSIDFFGTDGMDVEAVRAVLPVKPGDQIGEADFKSLKTRIRAAVERSTGHQPTDVAGVCCGAGQQMALFIGLPGQNSQAVHGLTAPSGDRCLPDAAMHLYNRAEEAMIAAIKAGQADEDQDKGYALSQNPAARARQLEIREFAQTHAALVEDALRECSRTKHREAAAEILGYADRSLEQIEALVSAARDPDSDVRNNATRALWVMASADPRGIPSQPFIELLNSGLWLDRNKGGLVLMALTQSRPPELLAQLRHDAMDSLVEMARWHDEGHASPYRLILGRMAGWDDRRTNEASAAGRIDEIVTAARRPAGVPEPSPRNAR